MYREEIQVLDCTVRDGGLINNYQFSESFVKSCYRAACDAGIDYWEIGKKLEESEQYPRDKWGRWNFCADDDIKMVVDSYEKALKTLIGGGSECLHPNYPQTCCEKFAEQVAGGGGGQATLNVLNNT